MVPAQKKIALVTGANKGIGFEVVKQLAQKGIHVYLTSRNEDLGKKACSQLVSEGLDVEYHPLDVTIEESCDRIFSTILRGPGRLDILVNNAGVFLDPWHDASSSEEYSIFNSKLDTIRRSIETNTFGALRLIQRFVPLMKKNQYGRIINVSTGMAQLSEMNGGFPGYRLSKVALNAVTRIVADELKGAPIQVNSVCPGWVKTDMGGPDAELSTREGADTIVWLAVAPPDGPTGLFFRERKPIEW